MANPLLFIPEGLVLGLATGPVCLASCGPVYAPYLMQKSRTTYQSAMTLVQLSAGRFITYMVIGGIAGALGKQIFWLEKSWFTASAYLLFSFFLVISALRTKQCDEGCHTAGWMRFAEYPFLLGLMTGISVCPSFLLALTRAIDHGGWLAGSLLFGAFFIGTNIYFVPFTLLGMIGKTYRLRNIARVTSFCVALWFTVQAFLLLFFNRG
jgi:sulfite exporter TauE/SafE